MKLSSDINTDFEVTTLSYLQKLIIVMMNLNMKISKSEIARHMGVDRRAVDKYSNVFDFLFYKFFHKNNHTPKSIGGCGFVPYILRIAIFKLFSLV